MDMDARIEQMLLELGDARRQLERAERMLADGRASITARDARLGGAHELAYAQHEVEVARRRVEQASEALETERAALPPRTAN